MQRPLSVPHEFRHAQSFDGTRLRYLVAGEGPLFVLCPGLGTPMVSYRKIIERFGSAFRFLCWDPRGFLGSSVPAAGARALRVEDHVGDLMRLLEVERMEPLVVGGWSMGVQLSLAYVHANPGDCQALALINGAAGSVLSGADLGVPIGERAAVGLVKAMSSAGPALGLAARALLDRQPTIGILRMLGIAGGDGAHDDFFREVAREFKHHDFELYLQMLLRLHEHSAEPLLPEIELPALVTCGTHDRMTPPKLARKLASDLPRGELVEIKGGTHYTMLEYPEELNRHLEGFLRRVLPEPMKRVA